VLLVLHQLSDLRLRKEQLSNQAQHTLIDVRELYELLKTNLIELKACDELVVAERSRFKVGGGSLFLINARKSEAYLAKLKVHETLLDQNQITRSFNSLKMIGLQNI